MGANSKIEWCDHTFNPWMGCTRVGPGCDNCYAATSTPVRVQGIEWGPGQPRVRTKNANWQKLLKWNRDAERGLFVQCADCGKREFRKWDTTLPPGGLSCCSNKECLALPESDIDRVRPRVFCASLADVFDNEVPQHWRQDLFNLIGQTPHLDWLLLTKRIGNVSKLMAGNTMPSNVWLGITVVNQEEADRDIPKLLEISATVRFLSIEPLLGPIDLNCVDFMSNCHPDCTNGFTEPDTGAFVCSHCENSGKTDELGIDWVIAGGESGPNARPSHPDWYRSLRDQCEAAGVPYLFKQWGEWAPYDRGRTDSKLLASPGCLDMPFQKFGKKLSGRLLDGREHNGFPDL